MHFPEWYMLLFHPLFWAALAIAIVGGIGLVAYAIWREKRVLWLLDPEKGVRRCSGAVNQAQE